MNSYSRLKEFDWSARMVLSSEQLSGLRKPHLLLNLFTEDASGKVKGTIVELTIDEVNVLLNNLKALQSTIRQISE